MIKLLQQPKEHLGGDRYFICHGLSWAQFCAIRDSFASVAGVRLYYCQGILELVGIGKLHESIRCLLEALLCQYFLAKDIEFFPSGSYSQIVEGETAYQSDLSYCFRTDKDRPDLAIEIAVISSSPIKLRKYQLMEVPEVWFWEDGSLTVYSQQEGGYQQREDSDLLPELDVSLIQHCLLLGTLLDSPLEALQELRSGIENK